MTSIAIAYNKLWIAIAADSAATTQYWSSIKIFNANKIFSLSSNGNIGVWMYQSAWIWNTPWELIFNEYKSLNRSFDSLEEYVLDFVKFVWESNFIPDENIDRKMEKFILELNNTFNAFMQNKKNEIKWEMSEELADKYTKEFFDEPLFSEINDSSMPLVLNDEWSEFIKKEIEFDEKIFHKILIENDAKKLMIFKDKIVIAFKNALNKWISLDSYTWLIFVWYGNKDYLPKVFRIQTKMKYKWNLYMTFSQNESSEWEPYAAAEWYADAETIQNIVLWYSSRLENNIKSSLKKCIAEICKNIKKKYNKDINDDLNKIIDNVNLTISQFGRNEVNSFFWALNFLTIEELWNVVETLVSISSFKKKVSNKPETVWWNTDVAIISRENWFIRYKKKKILN